MNTPNTPTAQDDALSDDELLRLETQLCFPVTVAARLLVQEYRHVLSPMGLTHPQYLVMLALWQHDHDEGASESPLTATELSVILSMETATLTGLVRRLEGLGLVTREPDPRDDRRRRLLLTPEGRALRAQAKLVPRRMLERLRLTPEQVEQVRDAATLLVAALRT
ncbi:MAG: MarR family winged helix-turn-helix transcriptional regulator [Pseudoclavibacter sp.]